MATAIGVIVGVVVVLLIVGLVLLLMRRAQRRRELQEMYGPEYERAVQQAGGRRAAERDLEQRREQRSQLQISPLDPASRQHYTQAWTQVQGRFVDDPQQAVADADELVTAVMRQRGYPTEGFDEQAKLLSVDHAATVDEYRSGHHIAGLARQRQATTEQLRQGMIHYRTLFGQLVERDDSTAGGSYGSGHQGQPVQPQGQPVQPQVQPTQGYPQGQQAQGYPQGQQTQGYPQGQQPPSQPGQGYPQGQQTQGQQAQGYQQAPGQQPQAPGHTQGTEQLYPESSRAGGAGQGSRSAWGEPTGAQRIAPDAPTTEWVRPQSQQRPEEPGQGPAQHG